ncbi:hypothetical protein UAY_02294 [Enterococcus moraviensis ATCC BAA-383]|uniref:Uncharacterized protein n=1 Tax=Enterococcus moraviensis ATCC BAA-383 TaxID=1158609 RepID=R2SUX0_9ENTE|nr:hypothetical protein [Enterococcus moraviensis]EOH99025.1 hypothetical protein UAY_02294 [Enterococcus moraviensis ATCC BAA-383]EOT71800.1 hypothetical protein I586_01607 [Enterococcus moraviensis ATCC BAA-383]OJG67920.1 hypothetical protein RV09_GL002031 [Enterococcus moraviensis]
MKKYSFFGGIFILLSLLCLIIFNLKSNQTNINNFEGVKVRKILVSITDTENQENSFLLDIQNAKDIEKISALLIDIDNSNLKEINDWGLYTDSKTYRISVLEDYPKERFYSITGNNISIGTESESSFYSVTSIGKRKIEKLLKYVSSIEKNDGNDKSYY